MIHIRKATVDDVVTIAEIGSITFLDTYLPNTPKEAVYSFVDKVFSLETLKADFENPAILYHLMYAAAVPIGYSKIVLNAANEHLENQKVTKLDRFYVIKEFHGKHVGKQLFDFIVNFSRKQQQHGIWLYVLIANKRAVNFYQKNNFTVVGEYDFKVSETRYNPNYVMFLQY